MPKDISLPIAAPTAEFESGEPQRLAAIDLGSNSFHLLVANYQNERLQVVARLGEKVQLALLLGNVRLAPQPLPDLLAALDLVGKRLRSLSLGRQFLLLCVRLPRSLSRDLK